MGGSHSTVEKIITTATSAAAAVWQTSAFAVGALAAATGPGLFAVLVCILGAATSTKVLLWVGGASVGAFQATAQLKASRAPVTRTLKANNGQTIELRCKPLGARAIDGGNVVEDQCSTFYGDHYLLKIWVTDVIKSGRYATQLSVMIAPRYADDRVRADKANGDNRIALSEAERKIREYEIGSIETSLLGFASQASFNLERDSLKALMLSSLRTAARVNGIVVDEFTLERVAQEQVMVVSEISGALDVRANKLAMMLAGTFEALIVLTFMFCLWGTVAIGLSRLGLVSVGTPVQVNHFASLVSTLGASLTYLGLLGTLLGIYYAVSDLSSVDFVDEMKKVFDQTRSFGSMSLALGTSVLGLSGALILWFIHGFFNYVEGQRLFET